MFLRNVFKLRYSILTVLIGIAFIIYMAFRFETSYSVDVVGGWERAFIFINFILHIPFLTSLLVAVIFYLNNNNIVASSVLGIVSIIYLILHIIFSYSISPISLFPILGVVISIICIIEYKIFNKKKQGSINCKTLLKTNVNK